MMLAAVRRVYRDEIAQPLNCCESDVLVPLLHYNLFLAVVEL